MHGKLTIINSVGLGLLYVFYAIGLLPILLAADKFYAIPIVGTLTLLAIALIALNRISASLWLADKLPAVGLALTVTGLLWASNGDLEAIEFKRDIIHSLVGNLMGVMGWLWVEFNARMLTK